MPPTISITPQRYSAQVPAHRFRQGNRHVYYFTLDLPTLDALLPQRIDDSVVREANRRLTPSHARNIQNYLEERSDWLLGPLLLGIAPNALEFEPYQDEKGNEISPDFGRLRIVTNRANTMRISMASTAVVPYRTPFTDSGAKRAVSANSWNCKVRLYL